MITVAETAAIFNCVLRSMDMIRGNEKQFEFIEHSGSVVQVEILIYHR